MYLISSLHDNDQVFIISSSHYEDSFESDSYMAPWVTQKGLIHKKLDLSNLEDIEEKLDIESPMVVNSTKNDIPTKIGEVNLYSGSVLPPRLAPQKKVKWLLKLVNL